MLSTRFDGHICAFLYFCICALPEPPIVCCTCGRIRPGMRRPSGSPVVLITPDDEGGLAGASVSEPRARQDVIFELGFFIGKLGASHVAPLVKNDVVRPSDFDRIGYIPLDNAGG
ncbi:TIR domain-containing protein [Rhizobium ruizarguesonis]|uniref:TIR domain-containing protein n=2 Tax=Rhizobium ruizarguesonis TaxID=2081791 RepID=UPI0028BF12EA|nr:TIR domain-containing protein [Rhizobium ruizarguesonis]